MVGKITTDSYFRGDGNGEFGFTISREKYDEQKRGGKKVSLIYPPFFKVNYSKVGWTVLFKYR